MTAVGVNYLNDRNVLWNICEECPYESVCESACRCETLSVGNADICAEFCTDEIFFSKFEMPDEYGEGDGDGENDMIDDDFHPYEGDFHPYEEHMEDLYDPFHSIGEEHDSATYTEAERLSSIVHRIRRQKLKITANERARVIKNQKRIDDEYNWQLLCKDKAITLQPVAREILLNLCGKLVPTGVDQIIADFVPDIKMVVNVSGKITPVSIQLV